MATSSSPLLLVLAADHLVGAEQFRQVIDAGRKPAEEGRLVTLACRRPRKPATAISRPANPSPLVDRPMFRSSALWRSPIRQQPNSSWRAASPGTAACSCSAPAPCWRNWATGPGSGGCCQHWSKHRRLGIPSAGAGSLCQVPQRGH